MARSSAQMVGMLVAQAAHAVLLLARRHAGITPVIEALKKEAGAVNQAILFPDREEWDDARQCLFFPALVGGFQVYCALSAEGLAHRFGGDAPDYWLKTFSPASLGSGRGS